jgi:hypothetical protein
MRKLPLTACLAIFTLNAVICWPLFSIEYLDDFQSNEGFFIAFGKFMRDYWPHCGWVPWFNAGMPFEDIYLPLVPALVAVTSLVTHSSLAHIFHAIAALAYCLGPVFLFLFAWKVSGKLLPSLSSAVLWSLFSPSALIPQIWRDMGSTWGSRRLQNIVYYGETPHNVALCLLPLALFVFVRFLEKPAARRLALSVLAAAVVFTTNAFGIVGVSVSLVLLVLSGDDLGWRPLLSAGAVLATAYLLICRVFPPSLIRLIATNARLAAANSRPSLPAHVLAALFLLTIAALCWITRRLPGTMLRFSLLFTAFFGGITVLAFWKNLGFLPQPPRYHLEFEVGVCLLVAFALEPLLRRLSPRAATAAGLGCLVLLAWPAAQDFRFARRLIHPVTITRTVAYRQAHWIADHFPGQRVMVASENQWWFNLFADNPQLGAGPEPSAPNWMQRVAVYVIYSGENAGDQDGPISVFWLKAFGCAAVTVPGPTSQDHYHPIRNPAKFDALLPLVWREGGDSIYQVPLRSPSLAHVIPASAVVSRQPIHGLDIGPARAYVAALEDPAIPPAALTWENPQRARISADLAPSQVISVQVTYDPGWRATLAGRPVPVGADQLGMIIIEPHRTGHCDLILEFTPGFERTLCFGLGAVTALVVLALLLWPSPANKLASQI